MPREKVCLECGHTFTTDLMVRGRKTNDYGDKSVSGWLCRSCFKKRIAKRTRILSFGAILFVSLGVILFIALFWFRLTAEGYSEFDLTGITEIYIIWGSIMLLIGLTFYILRNKERSKVI
ncbi:MAG: hypothetical protein ACTSW1_13785 [Candidatus Hodarchaeales archaeon]